MSPPGSDYISTKQLARYLGVTPNMLEKHRSARKGFPFAKVGAHVVYHWPTIKTILASASKTP